MKNKRRTGWVLHTVLIVVVLCSVVLSALIWISPAYFQRIFVVNTLKKDKNVSDDVTPADKKKLTDIYQPTAITYTKNASVQLTSNRVDVVNLVGDYLNKTKFTDIKRAQKVTKARYLKLLQTKNSFQLNYGAKVSFGMLKDYLENADDRSEDSFDHIVLSLNSRKIYFLEDEGLRVYEAKLTKKLAADFKKLVKDKDIEQAKISYRYQNGHVLRLYEQKMTVPRYSYLYNKENIGLYVTRLLGAEKSNSSTVNSREQNGEAIYSNDAGQKISLKDKTGLITYTDYVTEDQATKYWTLNDHLNKAFEDLEQLGVNLADVKYSEYDNQNKNVIYRSYIDGFPVISARDFGTYQLQNKPRDKRIIFSQYSLQVPVPAAGKAVTLQPTSEILSKLQDYNISSDKVTDITIGYQVTQNKTASLVIDLTPVYFVKYNNVWVNYEDLITNKKWGDNDNEL